MAVMDDFFEWEYKGVTRSDYGRDKEALLHQFPRAQQLAFVTTEYMWKLNKAIKALRESYDAIRPEPPQGE